MMNWIEALNRYNNFAECLLLDYWSADLCRDVVILISNIWSGPGEMRADLDELAPFRLRFKQCMSFEVHNTVSRDLIAHPERVNWGINEFALIRSADLPDGMVKVEFLWESSRTIQIICSRVEVEEVQVTEELANKYRW